MNSMFENTKYNKQRNIHATRPGDRCISDDDTGEDRETTITTRRWYRLYAAKQSYNTQ